MDHFRTFELRRASHAAIACFLFATALPACASDNDLVLADAARDAQAAEDAKTLATTHASDLHAAAVKLCAAAPAPAADGWVRARDGEAIEAMKAAWKDAQRASQSVKGSMDLLFPDLSASLDSRYDEAIATGADLDLFDDQGFIGLHAVERILWSDRIRGNVTASESTLAGYVPASFPRNAAEATRFRDKLCPRLVGDTASLEAGIRGATIDSIAAYGAATRLVDLQLLKLIEAGNKRDESRYAGYTLADMGSCVASAEATHAVFKQWLLTKPGGPEIDAQVDEGFAVLAKEYAAFGTDTLPQPPQDWNSVALTHDMLETSFGQLFGVVSNQANTSLRGSLAHSMGATAGALGITTPP